MGKRRVETAAFKIYTFVETAFIGGSSIKCLKKG